MIPPGTKFLRVSEQVKTALGGLLDLLLPPTCNLCGSLLDSPGEIICPDCRKEFEPLEQPVCARCGQPVRKGDLCLDCALNPPPCHKVRSGFAFAGGAKDAVIGLKLRGRRSIATVCADFLSDATLFGLDLKKQDLLVPVPLHPSKLARRGFNPASLIARRLSKRAGPLMECFHLLRIKKTPSQSEMSNKQERARNMDGAFAVTKTHPYQGKIICLVDDVVTTGATLYSCARALLDAGAREVNAVTVARTLHHDFWPAAPAVRSGNSRAGT
jgi:ComF family protein